MLWTQEFGVGQLGFFDLNLRYDGLNERNVSDSLITLL
jgi:hypothetical protein